MHEEYAAASVVACLPMPVAMLVASTLAFGTALPETSTTLPVSDP
ncbi:MAG: hypothetical protein ABSG03_33400 [Bryobacteraceae bacterium]